MPPPDSKKKSPAVGGEAKEKRRVLVRKRSHGGQRGEVAAGSMPMKQPVSIQKKDGKKHEMHKKSGPASSPGPAVGGKSAQPVVGRVGCRAGPAADSYYSQSYSGSDTEPPAVGRAEVESTAVRREAPCESESSDSRHDRHHRLRRQSLAKKRKSGDGVVGQSPAKKKRKR